VPELTLELFTPTGFAEELVSQSVGFGSLLGFGNLPGGCFLYETLISGATELVCPAVLSLLGREMFHQPLPEVVLTEAPGPTRFQGRYPPLLRQTIQMTHTNIQIRRGLFYPE